VSTRFAAGVLLGVGVGLLMLFPSSWLAPVLGVWQLAVSGWLARRPAPAAASWAVVGGALSLLLGLGLALGGEFGAGFAAGALGAASAFVGAQLSLAAHPSARPLPAPHSLRTSLAVATDESMKWLWHATSLVSPPPAPGAWIDALRAAAERNRGAGVLEDPARAHPAPPALDKCELLRRELPGLPAADLLRFESGFVPRDPEVREAYLALDANRTAQALVWRHRGERRPALIVIHGYGMGRPLLDAHALEVPWLFRTLGLDVVLVTLPLHGARAAGRRSGAGFLDGHPLVTNAAFEQAIWDLRRIAGWLRSEGAPAVGVYGMSLGGYTAALFASLERGLACAVPYVPAVSLPGVLGASRSPEQQRAREALGLDDALLSEAWASHDPLRHRPLVAPEGRLILAGASDRICPPDQAQALWEHWERPSIHWFEGSHLAHFGQRGVRERLAVHLRETLFVSGQPTLSRFRTLTGRAASPA
jgi:dienelactone hydrolase